MFQQTTSGMPTWRWQKHKRKVSWVVDLESQLHSCFILWTKAKHTGKSKDRSRGHFKGGRCKEGEESWLHLKLICHTPSPSPAAKSVNCTLETHSTTIQYSLYYCYHLFRASWPLAYHCLIFYPNLSCPLLFSPFSTQWWEIFFFFFKENLLWPLIYVSLPNGFLLF